MAWFEEKNPWLGVPNSWLVILTVFLLFFTGVGAGLRARWDLPSGQEVVGDVLGMEGIDDGWVPSTDKYERQSITIDFEIDQSDWKAGGAVTPTTPVYNYFYDEPSLGDTGVGITVAGEDITIIADNDGIIWLDVYGGTDFYLVESVLRGLPNVKMVKVNDWDNDDTLDCLVKLDMSRFLTEQHEYKPTYVMELPLLDVDVTGLDDDNPADQTTLGEAQVTATITWMYSGVTAEDGFYISELWVLTNDTVKGNDVTLKSMTIDGSMTAIPGGSVTLSPQHDSIGGAYAAYYIRTSDADEPLDPVSQGFFRGTNKGDALYFTLSVQCNFETDDGVTIDIYFTLVSPDGTTAQETDSVTLGDA